MIYERFPYKEEVTGSNPVAPTRVFQKSLHINSQKTHKRPAFCLILYHMIMKKVLVFLILLSCSTNDDVQIQTEPTTIPTNTTLSIDVDPDVSFANFVDYWTKNLKNYRPISNDDLKTTNELGKWPDTIPINDSITCYLRVVGTVTVGVADENHPVEFDSHLNLQWWLAESYVCDDDLITNLYGPPFFQDNE